MKIKPVIGSTLLTVIVLSLLTVAVLQAAPPQQDIPKPQATLLPVQGETEVLRPGNEDWQLLDGSFTLAIGDRIRTKTESIAAIIWLNDGTRLEIYPNTELYINDWTIDDAGKFRIETTLYNGMVVNRVLYPMDDGSAYILNTPSVLISAVPSVYGVKLTNTLETSLALTQGSVNIQHQQTNDLLALNASVGLIVPLRSLGFADTVSLGDVDEDLLAVTQNTLDLIPLGTQESGDGTQEPGDNGGVNGTQEPGDGGSPNGTPDVDDDDDDDDSPNGTPDTDDDDDDDDDDDNSGRGGGDDDDDDNSGRGGGDDDDDD